MGRLYKRRRPQDAYTAGQMLQILAELKLVAVLQGNCIWVAVDAHTAGLLDKCCTGQQDGGPGTAVEISQVVRLWSSISTQVTTEQGQEQRQGQVQHQDVEGEQPSQQNQQQQQHQDQGRQQQHSMRGQPQHSREEELPIAIRLSLEEAFFLKYTLDSLTVLMQGNDGQLEELGEQALWDACRSIRGNFVASYAGYHHLKCKGWLPRSGLLYGVDYVLYQMHPTAVHSEFGVMLVPLSGPHRPDLGWLDVQITNRLINQVSKRLLLLYLHEAAASPGHATPACLGFFTAEERLLKRWVPSSTRM